MVLYSLSALSEAHNSNNVTVTCDGQDARSSQCSASTIKAKATFQQLTNPETTLLRATQGYSHFTKDNFIRNS